MTPGVLETLRENGINPLSLLARHTQGDWGDLDEHDKQANEEALVTDASILSAYGTGDTKLWIITEAVRSAMTILRPDEY